jgi:hypothetical protein
MRAWRWGDESNSEGRESFGSGTQRLPRTAAHPFYEQLKRVMEERGFDEFVEQQCVRFYAQRMERPGPAPGR